MGPFMGLDATAVAAPYFVAAALLGVGGLAKLRRPDAAAGALGAAGVRGGRRLARSGGVVELAVATAAIVDPGPLTAGLLAGTFALFALLLVRLLRSAPDAPCGCFGAPEETASRVHVALDLAAAAVAALAVVVVPPAPAALAGSLPAAGIPYLACLAAGTYAAYLASTLLPSVLGGEEASR